MNREHHHKGGRWKVEGGGNTENRYEGGGEVVNGAKWTCPEPVDKKLSHKETRKERNYGSRKTEVHQ
jgi:hypothetical protein